MTTAANSNGLAYSLANHLASGRGPSVTRNGQPYGAYVYNALEQLVSRISDAPAAPLGMVHYIHDLDGHVIAEADAATGAIIRTMSGCLPMTTRTRLTCRLPLSARQKRFDLRRVR
jgi:hypothetical protein